MAIPATVDRQHNPLALPLRRWAASPRRRMIGLFALPILVIVGNFAAAQDQNGAPQTERSAVAASTPIPLAIQRLEAVRTRLAAFLAAAALTRESGAVPAQAPGAPAPLTPLAVAVAVPVQDSPPPPKAVLPAYQPADPGLVYASGSPIRDTTVHALEPTAQVEPPPVDGMAPVRRSSCPRFATPPRRPPKVARQQWPGSVMVLPAHLARTAWVAPRLPPAERRR